MKEYDVIIIGGGASGLMTALQFENSKKRVLLLDAGYSLGKKIMVTGNGRCNLTNKNMSSKFFNVDIAKYLKQFTEKDTIKFFNSLGLEIYEDECGRVYPYTNSAKSVVDVITKKLNKLSNVEVINNSLVEDVRVDKNQYIIKAKENYKTSNLIISSGNIDNQFLKNLGVDFLSIAPSLVALKTKENTKNLDGAKISGVRIIAECCGERKSDEGELLFKENGLSGIAIFNLSTLFARKKTFNGSVVVDLLPNITNGEVVNLINKRCKIFDKVIDMFTGLFVDTIREEIFKRVKIDEKLVTSKLTKSKIEQIAYVIKNMHFTINGHYNNNQVVSGGVDLNCLTENLESKRHKGLYFTGEVVDVDGECGGYNLQWAWTSGAIVGRHLK